MGKIRNKNSYKIGDMVWWFDAWGTLRSGTIYDFTPAREGKIAKIYENGRKGACTGALIEACWPSKEACLAKEAERSAAQVAAYKESIQSVHDLVRFLYKHDVNSEYRDYDAAKAVKERAAELGVPVSQDQ